MIIRKPPFLIHHLPSVGSTNDYLKALDDAGPLTVVVADEQTAGRGRRERRWHSSAGEGLYFSLLLRPPQSMVSIQMISLLSGIAVAEALVGLGVSNVDIKWPNDVLIGDRKVCGILSEGASSGRLAPRVIVGIGVNLNHSVFPPELSEVATSVLIATGRTADKMEFLDQVLCRIADWYEVWTSGGVASIISRWEELSSYAFGQQVKVTTDGEEFNGTTNGLSPSGGLLIRESNGHLRSVLAGEVSRIRKQRP